MQTPDFRGIPLERRLKWAFHHLGKVNPKYCVIWEDPDTPEKPLKVEHPSPRWLAAIMNGGIHPSIDCYIRDKRIKEEYEQQHGSTAGFKWDDFGGASYPHADPEGPMTEKQAMEYLVRRILPFRVWAKQHNRPMFKIVPLSAMPIDKTFRNAWRLNDLDLEAA
jgi:hypothetical protein